MKELAYSQLWAGWLAHLNDKPAVGIELGTYRGESAEWMLANIFTHPEARYYCVDTFLGSVEHKILEIDCTTLKMQAAQRLEPYKDRCAILVGATRSVLRHWELEPADSVYIDAGHGSQDVLRDSVLAWELLKVGGVMIWDDYLWNWFPEPVDNPKMAIDAFLACYARHLTILRPTGYQIAVQKTDED